jgi:hypothetical protein
MVRAGLQLSLRISRHIAPPLLMLPDVCLWCVCGVCLCACVRACVLVWVHVSAHRQTHKKKTQALCTGFVHGKTKEKNTRNLYCIRTWKNEEEKTQALCTVFVHGKTKKKKHRHFVLYSYMEKRTNTTRTHFVLEDMLGCRV